MNKTSIVPRVKLTGTARLRVKGLATRIPLIVAHLDFWPRIGSPSPNIPLFDLRAIAAQQALPALRGSAAHGLPAHGLGTASMKAD